MNKYLKSVENWVIVAVFLMITLLDAGGFFEYTSAVLAIAGIVAMAFFMWQDKCLCYVKDWNTIALSVFTVMYLISAFWAVDSGMAVMGFVKFLPAILFYGILCRTLDGREKIIRILPSVGVLLVFFGTIMMQFESMKSYVSVAGRFAGSFQYPNTFALFLLVCFLITVFDLEDMVLKIGYSACLLFGILYTGSRTVWVLTAGVLLFLAFYNRKYRRASVIAFLVVCSVIAGILIFAGDSTIGLRLKAMSLTSSTLLGRLLYAKDAVKLVVSHPFGLGYYGYYFMEQEIQTGVYSVVNVHNEFLQIALDIGIIPAILFWGMIIRSVICKGQPVRNRIILLVMALHSLFDYNFQFIGMIFVLLLFLSYGELQKVQISSFTYVTAGIAAIAGIGLSVLCGVSNACYLRGSYKTAFRFGELNTMAEISQMEKETDLDQMKQTAQDILNRNSHVPAAYSVIAKGYYADGDIEKYIFYQMKAMRLAPYQTDAYVDYVNSLANACTQYLNNGDKESAKVCLDRIKEVPEILNEVKEKTSDLAWKIKDKPNLTLPEEYESLVQSMEEAVNGNQ